MIEVFKMINEYAPPIVDNFFIFRDNTHNLRHFQIIFNENKKTERYGSEAISYRTALFWENLPEEYKLANSLSEFKLKIKSWKCNLEKYLKNTIIKFQLSRLVKCCRYYLVIMKLL